MRPFRLLMLSLIAIVALSMDVAGQTAQLQDNENPVVYSCDQSQDIIDCSFENEAVKVYVPGTDTFEFNVSGSSILENAVTLVTSNIELSLEDYSDLQPEPIEQQAGGWALVTSTILMWWGSIALKIKNTPVKRRKSFVMYASNYDGAGTAAPSYITEDGKVIKLYPADALTAAEAGALNTGDAGSDTVIANMRTRIGELEALLVANGLLTEA